MLLGTCLYQVLEARDKGQGIRDHDDGGGDDGDDGDDDVILGLAIVKSRCSFSCLLSRKVEAPCKEH